METGREDLLVIEEANAELMKLLGKDALVVEHYLPKIEKKTGVSVVALRERLNAMKEEMVIPQSSGDQWLKKIHFFMEMLPAADKERRPGIIRDLWNALPVTSVRVDLGKNENFYHFILDGEETNHEIVVEEVENLTPKKFRIEFQRIYGILLPNLSYIQWACLVTEWLKNRELSTEVEEISEHQEIIDAILENITSSRLIKGIGASIFGTVYYHDDAILVPTDTIRNISEKINRNITLRKVSSIVSDYLLGSTKTYRTDDGIIRMWRFDPAKVGVDTTTALELGVEGDEDD